MAGASAASATVYSWHLLDALLTHDEFTLFCHRFFKFVALITALEEAKTIKLQTNLFNTRSLAEQDIDATSAVNVDIVIETIFSPLLHILSSPHLWSTLLLI